MKQFEVFSHLKVLIISGSTQAGGQSLKVAQYINAFLQSENIQSLVLDLHKTKIPFFGHHQADKNWSTTWQRISEKLKKAQAIVLISPEYNGGPSPALLNLMLYVADELKNKPVLLVGVSAGRGGAYPLAALRQNGGKDPQYLVIPQSLIVSQVYNLLNDYDFKKADLSASDQEVRQLIKDNLLILLDYAEVLSKMDKETKD